jgi:hypothetical protein
MSARLRSGKSAVLLLLAGIIAVPLSAATLASGSVTIDGTEALLGPNRVFRDGTPSTIAAPKMFPGTFACGGNCGFRTVTIPVASSSAVNVKVTGGTNGIRIFVVAYLNSFNVASLPTNYLGDPGSSVNVGDVESFQVSVPAATQLILAVSNTSPGLTGTINYEVSDGSPDANGVPTLSTPMLGLLGLMLAGCAAFTLRKRHA